MKKPNDRPMPNPPLPSARAVHTSESDGQFSDDESVSRVIPQVDTRPPPFDMQDFARSSETNIRVAERVAEEDGPSTSRDGSVEAATSPEASKDGSVTLYAQLVETGWRARRLAASLRTGEIAGEEAARLLRDELAELESLAHRSGCEALAAFSVGLGGAIHELAGGVEEAGGEALKLDHLSDLATQKK